MANVIEAEAAYEIQIDWNADEDWQDTYDDVTPHVLAGEGITIAGQGRDQARGTAPPQDASLEFALNNTSHRYSTENAASPISGSILPGRPCRARATYGSDWTLNDSTVTLNDPQILLNGRATLGLWKGHLDSFDEDPSRSRQRVAVHGKGRLGRLAEYTAYSAIYLGTTTGQAMADLMIAAGLDTDEYNIDPDVIANGRTLTYWYADGRTVAAMAAEIWETEGYSAYLGEDEDGVIQFQGRNYRNSATRSQNVQADLLDTEAADALPYMGFRINPGFRDIINQPYVDAVELRAVEPQSDVWEYSQTIILDGAGAASVTARTTEPFQSAVAPVVTTDFTLSTGTVTVSLSRTSGVATMISFTGGTAGAQITNLKLRATLYTVTAKVRVDASIDASTSIARYGERPHALDVWPGLSIPSAGALCDAMLLAYQEPRPIIEIDLVNRSGPLLHQMLTTEIGDRLHIEESQSGASLDVLVEQKQHRITAGNVHMMTLGCEKVVESDWALYDVDLYGTGVFGQ